MRAYLTRTEGAAEAAQVIEREAEDESLKMINLARDWLTALLPHVLAKINRVSYGLLSAKDVQALEQANGGARVPTSRRLLAVPFVGKDIPSQTNEFSHPDVVIGLTICAYRHEGLRRGDFRQVCCALCSPNSSRRRDRRANENRRGDGRSSCDAPADARGEAREEAAAAARRTGASLKADTTDVGLARAVALAEDETRARGGSPSTTRCGRCSSSTCATSTRWRRSISSCVSRPR